MQTNPPEPPFKRQRTSSLTMAFNISVTNDGGALINLQVTKDMTIQTLKACISADLSIPSENQILRYQGTTLDNNDATLESCGITSHEMLQVSVASSPPLATVTTTPTNASQLWLLCKLIQQMRKHLLILL